MEAIEDVLRRRPVSLTFDRAYELLPRLEIDPEWQRKHDAGELPDGIMGLLGCMRAVWPDESLTTEEAQWILELEEHGTQRAIASWVVGDSNQIYGSQLLEASRGVLKSSPAE